MKRPKFVGLTIAEVHLGAFDYTVRVVTGPEAEAVRYANWLHDGATYSVDNRRGAIFRSTEPGAYVPVLWVPRPPKTPREHATLAHEAVHAAFELAGWAGIKYCDDSEEVFCHVAACIVNGALEAWGKK